MSTDALLTIFLLAGVAAAAGLVGIWAAVSERHWFWRALAVWGCVAVLVPIRVWEPAMVFAVALPLVVVMIWGARGVRNWRGAMSGARNAAEGVPYRWVRFGLLDVLLSVAFAGLLLAVFRAILKAELATTTYEVFVPAVLMAGLTATVYWLVVGPWRPAAGLLVVLMTPLGAWLLWPKVEWLFAFDTFALFRSLPVFTNLDPRSQYLYGLAVGFAMLLALELMIGAGMVVLPGIFQTRKAGVFTRASVSLVSLTAGLVGLWFYSQMLCPPPTPPVLQRPNDSATQILRLAERIQRLNPLYDINSSGAHPGAAGDELRQLYDNVLERLEAWTEMRFEPIEQPTEDDWQFEFGWHPLFELCESIEAEWREAIANDNYERAFNLVVANLRLSALRLERYEISLGSYLADNTINESLAYVIDGRKSLTDRQISILASTICEMERRHPSPEQVFARQRNIQREQTRHRWQFDLMSVLTNRDEMRLDYAQQSHDLWMAKNRLLRTDLAIRQYRKTQGKWPESIVELVPEFLEKLLIDPYSNASLVYRIEGDEFVLYSVGQDQVDHGGRFGSVADQFSDGFDLDIDTFTRPLGVIVEPKVRSESERGRGEKHEDAKGTKGEAG